jgi:hypothetical protein
VIIHILIGILIGLIGGVVFAVYVRRAALAVATERLREKYQGKAAQLHDLFCDGSPVTMYVICKLGFYTYALVGDPGGEGNRWVDIIGVNFVDHRLNVPIEAECQPGFYKYQAHVESKPGRQHLVFDRPFSIKPRAEIMAST